MTASKQATRSPHSIGSDSFDPAYYDFVDVFYLGSTLPNDHVYHMNTINKLQAEGWSSGGSSRKCAHCGKALSYSALMLHKPSETYIHIGQYCLEGTFDNTREAFLAKRKSHAEAVKNRARIARQEQALAEHPLLADLSYLYQMDIWMTDYESNFLHDMSYRDFDKFSGGQLYWTEKILTDVYARNQKQEAKRAAEKAELADSPELTAGKTIVIGEILSAKWKETRFGGGIKIMVKMEDGNKVYGQCPDSIENPEKGMHVSFGASVTVSDNDKHFGFFRNLPNRRK